MRSACRRSARRAARTSARSTPSPPSIAGVAGALLTQTTETVSLGVLDFQRSADMLVILILGGAGRLYGGLVGAIIFMVARDQFSGINPQYWYFWIGVLLIAVVMFLPNGILGGLAQLCTGRGSLAATCARRIVSAGASPPAGSTRASARSWSPRTSRSTLPQRRALRADRAERRRQDHADQPDDRHAAARRAAQILLGDEDITALGPEAARQARAGAHLPDQQRCSRISTRSRR